MIPVNYIAVLVAAVASMIIGALWYSPLLFAQEWMRLIGKSEKECKEGMAQMAPQYYLLSMGAALVVAYVMSFFLYYVGARGWIDGVKVGVLAWLGFTAMTSVGDYLFAGRPLKLFVLNNAYQLVVLSVMGGIIATLSY